MNKGQAMLLIVGLVISFLMFKSTMPYMKENPPLIIVFVFGVSSFFYLFIESMFAIYFSYIKRSPYKLFE